LSKKCAGNSATSKGSAEIIRKRNLKEESFSDDRKALFHEGLGKAEKELRPLGNKGGEAPERILGRKNKRDHKEYDSETVYKGKSYGLSVR